MEEVSRAGNAAVVLARAARGGSLCGLVGSIVLRATFALAGRCVAAAARRRFETQPGA